MSANYVRYFLTVLLLASPVFGRAKNACLQEAATIRLETIRVNTCLKGDPGTDDIPPTAFTIEQLVENVSKKQVEIVVYHDLARRGEINIFRGMELVSKRISFPPVDGSGAGSHESNTVDYETKRLKPGDSLRFEYVIADLLVKQPIEKADYSIIVNTSIPFRFLNEPPGSAYELRFADELARKEWVKPLVFQEVRLK